MQVFNARTVAILFGVLLAGMMLGSEDVGTEESDDSEWAMFGQRIAVAESSQNVLQSGDPPLIVEGTSFLYNKRTGQVFRVFLGCGEVLGRNGCLEELPVAGQNEPPSAPPSIPSVYSPNQIRR
ncbi:MAG: hypothetical protein OXN89_05985 [Bryobacterales bacterium]|nr:hypothetical protein [Bryobacterales bacterium]